MDVIKSFRANADIRDAIPVGAIFATALISALWNSHVGIVWRAPLIEALATPVWPLPIALFYTVVRPKRQFAETALYVALWMIYGVFGGQLSYLGISLGFPLRDAAVSNFDTILGLDWHKWVEFTNGNGWLNYALKLAYGSFLWQPLLAVVIFAWCRPGRNRELLTGMILSATAVIGVATFLPVYGPGHTSGMAGPWPWDDVITALRTGSRVSLPILGIIQFPSLHAAAAVLMIVAYRDVQWILLPIVVLNLLMLAGTPWYGDHYMTDVVVGALIGVSSFVLARGLNGTAESLLSSLQPPAAVQST